MTSIGKNPIYVGKAMQASSDFLHQVIFDAGLGARFFVIDCV